MKMPPTIKDIAKIARVTPTTVSLALNNQPRVSEKTRRRILKIARDLKYHPNYIAKSLISRRSHAIGLIINNIADPFYPEIAKGIEEKADELGYSVILCNTNSSTDQEKKHIRMLRARGVDGIIFSTVLIDDPNIKPLVEDKFPFTLVNRTIYDPLLSSRIDYVVLDNFSGGYQVIDHLYRLGHDRIGIVTGELRASTAAERMEGAKKAMLDRRISYDPDLIVECDFTRAAAYHAAKKLLALKPPPTAIFAKDDNMALGVRETILNSGMHIPEDIALVGFDDIDVAALSGIDLTTVSQKKYEMGTLGVKILIDKIEKESSPMVNKIILQQELIVRKSCGFRLKGYCR
jgi:LacI family transcriptional regulator